MTPITADSAPESQSLSSKVNRSKQILLKSPRPTSKERPEDRSTGNLEFSVLHLLKIFLLVSQLQTWHKFHKSSHFGGTLGYIQMLAQASTRTYMRKVVNHPNLVFRHLPENYRYIL